MVLKTHPVAKNDFESLMQQLAHYKGAALYLTLKLRGASDDLARKLAKITLPTIGIWRSHPNFPAIEKQLIEGDFAQDAIDAARSDNVLQADLLIAQLIGRGLTDWDALDKEERNHTMEAVKMIKKDGGRKEGEESYEDSIHRMRKKKKA